MKKVLPLMLAMLLMVSFVSTGIADDQGHEDGHICFTRVDKDQNGKATAQELNKFYPDNKELFEKIDQDKDGVITHEEYEEYWYSQE